MRVPASLPRLPPWRRQAPPSPSTATWPWRRESMTLRSTSGAMEGWRSTCSVASGLATTAPPHQLLGHACQCRPACSISTPSRHRPPRHRQSPLMRRSSPPHSHRPSHPPPRRHGHMCRRRRCRPRQASQMPPATRSARPPHRQRAPMVVSAPHHPRRSARRQATSCWAASAVVERALHACSTCCLASWPWPSLPPHHVC